jgi:drug/metabolite transporter superfamily protein YnfA
MRKAQKAGFLAAIAVFILVGLVMLVAGFAAGNATLKIMGATWLPLGLLNLALFLVLAAREERR